MPMGKYSSFDACVRANRDKRDPQAYCGRIYWATEGRKKKKALRKASASLSGRGGSVSISESGDEVRIRTRLRKDGGHDVMVGRQRRPSSRVPHHHHPRQGYWHAVKSLRRLRKALSGPVATRGPSAPSPDIPGARDDQPYAVAHGPDNYRRLTQKAAGDLYERIIGGLDKAVARLDKQAGFPANLQQHLQRALAAVHGREIFNPKYGQVCRLLKQAIQLLEDIEREAEVSSPGPTLAIISAG